MKRIVFCIACFLGLVIHVTGQLPVSVSSKARGIRTLQAAFENPFDEDKFQALKMNLPRDNDLYVVEGDLLLTEQELRAYVVSRSQSEKPIDTSAELIVNVHKGRRDYYEDPGSRNLSYAVDRQSFPEEEMYKFILENMQIAGKDWQDACPECKVQFNYTPKYDLVPSTESVNFVVRYRDVKGSYIAAAFFPHDGPGRRYLNIDPSYFKTSVDKVGVLRHELGHVLGYRHEQTRGILGCYFEDDKWQPLTDYDPKSVMHYFCGGGGNLSLQLSEMDKAGHRKLYTISNTSNPADLKRYLRVRFEGSEILQTMPQVLLRLTNLGLIETRPYVVTRDGESLKSIYEQNFGLGLISGGMLHYAAQLNKASAAQKLLKIGDQVVYPDVEFKPRSKLVVLDKNNEKDQQTYKRLIEIWPSQLVSEFSKDENTTALSLTSYELNLEFDSEKEEARARAELLRYKHELKARYLVLGPSSINTQKSSIFSMAESNYAHSPAEFANSTPPPFASKQTPRQFMDEVMNKGGKIDLGIEGDLSDYLGETDYQPPPSPCERHDPRDCPEIILVDLAMTKHPDIPANITEGASPIPPIDDTTTPNKQLIRIGTNQPILKSQHATYMAGIIASQPNGFGLIGVYPNATIRAFDWNGVLNPVDPGQKDIVIREFAEFIQRRQTRYHNKATLSMPIFVFAIDWTFQAELKKETDRFDSSEQEAPDPWREVASTIQLSRPLIVVAAGQPLSSSADPQRITTLSLEGPRNLGDQESVIVVTAFTEDPATGRPTLWPRANFIAANDPQKLIHVAAPGLEILSTIPNTGSDRAAFYAVGSGTSQATAFVAAVVSSMVAAYPKTYNDSHLVKTRLQVTSNPFLKRTDAGKLAAGIVDFNLAMHDPGKDWLKKKGEKSFAEVANLKWLVNQIELVDLDGNKIGPIHTNKIYRIMFRDDICYVYTAEKRLGQIKKYGPGKLKTADITGLKLFELTGPTGARVPYTLSQIEDLVLFLHFDARQDGQ